MYGNLTGCCILYVEHPLCDLITKYIYFTGIVFVIFFLVFLFLVKF